MALLLSLNECVQTMGHATKLTAVTIDHGLRDGSADEARQVGQWCAALGIDHLIKRWNAGVPRSGLQATARAARYNLLAQAAQATDANAVFTGHNLDDQLETLSMRSPRGGGTGLGMAGIQAATLYEKQLWFLRPLLACSRQDLRDYLISKNQPWIDDPSNDNAEFERVAVRQAGIDAIKRAGLRTLSEEALKQRAQHMQAGAEALASAILKLEPEHVALSLTHIHEAVLQVALCYVGQKPHFAPEALIEKAMQFYAMAKNHSRFTAHGCLLTIEEGQLKITPEARHKGEGQFGFDYLIQLSDFALAHAFTQRIDGNVLPHCPIKQPTSVTC